MKLEKSLFFTFLTIAVIKANFLNAQICGSVNLTINKLVNKAELVVTGKVTEKYSFWNKQKSKIYTKYTIDINQSSNFSNESIYVTTEGGTVDDVTYKVFGTPGLNMFSKGVFFLSKKNDHYSLIDFANYNATLNIIENGSSILSVDDFNNILNAKHCTTFSFTPKNHKNYKAKQPIIANIIPKSVATGNNEILVISGSNFGNYSGSAKVSMRSAASLDSSVFVDIKASYIKSWTDSKIELIVPGDELTGSSPGAGSGKIQVTNQAGTTTTSLETIEVTYNKKVYNDIPIALRSKDNNGKIAVYVGRQLANDGALPAIKNAIKKWNCATNSNLEYSGIIDDVCENYDGLTVVCYDASLPDLRLGRTRMISRNCSSTGFADLLDADITINPNVDWAFNDSLTYSQYHFESVMLKLTNNDIAGGLDVMRTSIIENECSSFGAMIPYQNAEECNTCSNAPEISIKNLTESSAFLSWEKTHDTASYQIQYRYDGTDWRSYKSNTNYVIMFDLPPCTNVDWRLTLSCNDNVNPLRETFFNFTTVGCK